MSFIKFALILAVPILAWAVLVALIAVYAFGCGWREAVLCGAATVWGANIALQALRVAWHI